MLDKKYYSEFSVVIDNIDKDKKIIAEKWLKKKHLKNFSRLFNKIPNKILKIFAYKILEHQFDILNKNNKTTMYDVATIIIDNFIKKDINIIDICNFYSSLKNVTLFYYIEKYPELKDNIYYPLADLFDENYIILVDKFLINKCLECQNTRKKINSKLESNNNIEVSQIKTSDKSKQVKKDIRFTKKDEISASEFVKDLDYTTFDKVDSISEKLNDIVIILYSLEDNNDSKELIKIIPSIEENLAYLPELITSLGIFEILERAFENLIEFLSTITEEMLKDKDKKLLLVNLSLALINDFEKWIKIIFVEKSAKDIHYFDASFAANILKIENIFAENNDTNSDKKEECEIDFF